MRAVVLALVCLVAVSCRRDPVPKDPPRTPPPPPSTSAQAARSAASAAPRSAGTGAARSIQVPSLGWRTLSSAA